MKTPKEKLSQIDKLIASGMKPKDVAKKLKLNPKTVHNHVYYLRKKQKQDFWKLIDKIEVPPQFLVDYANSEKKTLLQKIKDFFMG